MYQSVSKLEICIIYIKCILNIYYKSMWSLMRNVIYPSIQIMTKNLIFHNS